GSSYTGGMSTSPPMVEQRGPLTLRDLHRMRRDGERFACLTAYDATTARWLERAGVHLLLVGDSAAQVVLGLDRTIEMPLEISIALTAAVKRGAPNTLVMADMPFMSYQVNDDEAMRHAGRFLTEGLADCVKLELDASGAPLVGRLSKAGIAVCAHVGFRPQQVTVTGYASAGRTGADAKRVIDDAMALEDAGAVLLLVEAVPPEVCERLVERTSVPVIGIGAGTSAHGQILVIQDLLGMTDVPPRFAEPVASMGDDLRRAGEAWVSRVREGRIGGRTYQMRPGESEKLDEMLP
ncbi:MAG: 3-methyl-2-oxobutanoate hydroxymethyltransferase, partial [Phycisphaerales bacterium]|nr:3-methyl-2-oxobutanoate hydroxymethyltransferase [Phycisphaerales bacterium]